MDEKYPNTVDPVVEKQIAKRICLSCMQEFESKHKFNRICQSCKEQQIRTKDYSINIKISDND